MATLVELGLESSDAQELHMIIAQDEAEYTKRTRVKVLVQADEAAAALTVSGSSPPLHFSFISPCPALASAESSEGKDAENENEANKQPQVLVTYLVVRKLMTTSFNEVYLCCLQHVWDLEGHALNDDDLANTYRRLNIQNEVAIKIMKPEYVQLHTYISYIHTYHTSSLSSSSTLS